MFSSAFAQDAAAVVAAQPPGLLANLAPLAIIIVIFYFFLLRPQQKRMREHQEMVNSLKRGDKVVTAGGILGTVTKVEDDVHVMVEIAPEVRVKIVRSTITHVPTRTAPANDTQEESDDTAEGEKPARKTVAKPKLAASKIAKK